MKVNGPAYLREMTGSYEARCRAALCDLHELSFSAKISGQCHLKVAL